MARHKELGDKLRNLVGVLALLLVAGCGAQSQYESIALTNEQEQRQELLLAELFPFKDLVCAEASDYEEFLSLATAKWTKRTTTSYKFEGNSGELNATHLLVKVVAGEIVEVQHHRQYGY